MGGEGRMVWGSGVGQERLEFGVGPQEDTVAHGDVEWPPSHQAESPQRKAPAPPSPLPLVVTVGSIPHGI